MRFVGTALVAGTMGVFFLLADGEWMRAGTETEGAAKADAPPTRSNHHFVEHFKRIRGTIVQNVDGQEIGVIRDLILQRSGGLQYVIVRSQGFLGRGRLVLVPISAIALTTAKVGTASIDLSMRQWKKAPEFRKEELARLDDPVRAESIARFYDTGSRSSHLAQGLETGAGLSSTGREPHESAARNENGKPELASDLVGKDLVNRQQAEIGHVEDLLVDFSKKKPALALVSVTQQSGADNFAVPIRLLEPAPGGRLRIDAEREHFERAQPFSPEAWQNLESRNSSEIYRWERW